MGLEAQGQPLSRGRQGLHPEAGAGAGVAHQALVGDTVQQNSPGVVFSPGPELTERESDGRAPEPGPGAGGQ